MKGVHLFPDKSRTSTAIGCVYVIVNSAEGRNYIGASVCPKQRILQHLTELRNGKSRSALMQSDFLRLGESCFSAEVLYTKHGALEEVKKHIIEKEGWYIKTFHPYYNISHNSTKVNASTVMHSIPPPRKEVIVPVEVITSASKEDIRNLLVEFCSVNDLTIKNLLSRSRQAKLVAGRNYLYRHLRISTNMSLSQIGSIFGRDHATVIHGINSYRYNPLIKHLTPPLSK